MDGCKGELQVMSRIILLTFLTDLISCALVVIYGTIVESFGLGAYAAVLTFGNILIPLLVAVICYHFISRLLALQNSFLRILTSGILMSLLCIVGLVVWAVFECYLWKSISLECMQRIFEVDFIGFLPLVVASSSFIIPTLDCFIFKKNRTEQNAA